MSEEEMKQKSWQRWITRLLGRPGERGVVKRRKPEIEIPAGPPPSELVIVEIWDGDGAQAERGDFVEVHYVGVTFSTGTEFDSSWELGEPFAFTLGAGQVIEGWDEGVHGMRVGGRRKLIIPPQLAYGDRGAGSTVAPGETLVFVIDLIAT
ncbi:peptidyl-prolyl cis-trans isomerase [Nocardia sputorum]|uniref:Peptidyl-prolyl cis-trans isomerase n=1 Tax=Nocardia sputorum TaxID=2984338 RepID=A0ABN6TTQ0_9NOCA|nr:peptidyl-prolyl cis-trans isomerase [Nocardia sputorum]